MGHYIFCEELPEMDRTATIYGDYNITEFYIYCVNTVHKIWKCIKVCETSYSF